MEKNPESTVRLHFIGESPFKAEGRIEEVFKSMEISKENSQFSKEEKNHLGESSNRDKENKGQDMEGYVILDHYKTYLHTLKPGQERLELTVAKESHSLRTVMMEVNGWIEVELIIDPGCQIIALSEAICHNLGLSNDLMVQLNMQSANGEVD